MTLAQSDKMPDSSDMTAPALNAGDNAGTLVPQKHGGAILRGGGPGRGGRRPDRIKRLAAKMLESRLPIIGHIADGVSVKWGEKGEQELASPTAGERIQALKLLKEIGLGDTIRVADVRSRLKATLELIRSRPTWESGELETRLDEVWK